MPLPRTNNQHADASPPNITEVASHPIAWTPLFEPAFGGRERVVARNCGEPGSGPQCSLSLPGGCFSFYKTKIEQYRAQPLLSLKPPTHISSRSLGCKKDRSREKTSPPSSLAVKRVMPLNHLDRESNEPTCRPKHSSASAQSEWRAAVKLLEAWALHPSR